MKRELDEEDLHDLGNLIAAIKTGVVMMEKYVEEKESCHYLIEHVIQIDIVVDRLMEIIRSFRDDSSSR